MSTRLGRFDALIFGAAFIQVADLQILPLLLPELSSGAWAGETVSGLISAYAIGAALIPTAVSLLFPRLPSGPLAAWMLAALGGLGIAFAQTESFTVALGLRALAGGCSGILSYAALGWAVRRSAQAVTAQSAGFLLAMVLGPAIGGLLAGAHGVSAPYMLTGTVALLLGAGLFLVARATDEPEPSRAAPLAPHKLLRDPGLRSLLLASVLIGAGVAGPITLFPTLLGDPEGAGLDLNGRALVYLVAGLGPLFALPLGARVLGRWGPAGVARAGAWFLAGGLALLPFAATSPVWAAGALLTALLVETLRRSGLQSLAATLPGEADRARFLALRALCVQLGIALGVRVTFGLYADSGLWIATLAGAAMAAASAFLVPAARSAAERGSEVRAKSA